MIDKRSIFFKFLVERKKFLLISPTSINVADLIPSFSNLPLTSFVLIFFTVLPKNYDETTKPLDIRELIGFIPWYFNLPDDEAKYAAAWNKIMDTTGFYAPVGLTVTEQSDPYFKISYEGHECQWNGPSWPFATTQTLKAMANFLNNYSLGN